MPTNFKLYDAAKAADDAYQTELERVYGFTRAGICRYKGFHPDPACQSAMHAKVDADKLWLREMRRIRETQT